MLDFCCSDWPSSSTLLFDLVVISICFFSETNFDLYSLQTLVKTSYQPLMNVLLLFCCRLPMSVIMLSKAGPMTDSQCSGMVYVVSFYVLKSMSEKRVPWKIISKTLSPGKVQESLGIKLLLIWIRSIFYIRLMLSRYFWNDLVIYCSRFMLSFED